MDDALIVVDTHLKFGELVKISGVCFEFCVEDAKRKGYTVKALNLVPHFENLLAKMYPKARLLGAFLYLVCYLISSCHQAPSRRISLLPANHQTPTRYLSSSCPPLLCLGFSFSSRLIVFVKVVRVEIART